MAKGVYTCIDGVSRNVKKIPVCIDGVSRNTKTGCACIDGVSRQFFSSGTPISNYSVGDSVYLNVNNIRKEFIIVQQGRPGYYSWSGTSLRTGIGLDGTWLLMKDIYTTMNAPRPNSLYSSNLWKYLDNTFFTLLDENVQNIINQVDIHGNKKIFLLSLDEVGYSGIDGISDNYAPLAYFNGASSAKRIAYYNGSAYAWWTGSQRRESGTLGGVSVVTYYYCYVESNGSYGTTSWSESVAGIRPAFIIPSTTLVDSSNNIIA